MDYQKYTNDVDDICIELSFKQFVRDMKHTSSVSTAVDSELLFNNNLSVIRAL